MKKNSYGEIPVTHLNTSDGYYSALNKGMEIPLERHDHFETVITLKNNFIHTVNGVSFQPQVGDVVILRPHDWHSAHPIDDSAPHICRDIYINQQLFKEACDYISPTLFVKIMTQKDPPSFHLNENELTVFEESMDFSYLYAMATDYEIYKSVKRIVACRVIGTYVKKSFESEKPLSECLTNLLNKLQSDNSYKKSVSQTAKELGYSPDYLNRIFREYFGKSIEQHITECKVYDSLTLLLQTDMTVNEIASKIGWECTGNYINHFKKIYNTTPAKYRREYKSQISKQRNTSWTKE